MKASAHRALSKIGDAEWRELALRLTRYTLSVSRHLRWRTHNPEDLPKGETVGSIVSKAIEKLYSGTRDWKPVGEPNLERFLQGTIDSLLSHLAQSADSVRLIAISDLESNGGSDWENPHLKCDPVVEWLVPPGRSPEEILAGAEQIDLEERTIEELRRECSKDPLLATVLDVMLAGCQTAAAIAEAKAIPVSDIYNATKRLDRKVERLRRRVFNKNSAQQTL